MTAHDFEINHRFYCLHRFGLFVIFSGLLLLTILPHSAQAACSSHLGKVVINEYNYINNYIELKVLDSTLTAGGANPFAGWKLAIWKKKGSGSMEKAKEEDVSSNYTDSARNTCRTTNYTYVRIPFSGTDMTNDTIVVLWDSNGGKKIIDMFRLGQSSLAAYPASINSGYSQYDQCPTIEALPSPYYDAPLVGNAGNKDIARLPDGTGPWTISNGTGANSQESVCTTNNALFALAKTPNTPSVGIGAGNTFIWTVTVTNGGTVGNLSNTTVKDTLPANMFLSLCPTGATCTGNTGAYSYFEKNVGQLTPGASATISATAYVSTAGIYTNTATATATELNPGYTQSSGSVTASASSLHHVRLNHTGAGVTCTGSTVTVYACNSIDSGGTCPPNTLGLTGNIVAGSTSVPFVIANGSNSTTVSVPVTTQQTVTFEATGLSLAAQTTSTCWNGSTASCSHVYSDSGFLFDVPNHISETLQIVNISAVKKSDNSLACIPAFKDVTKSVAFQCNYTNPATGTLPVRVNGSGLACDGTGYAVSLAFDATGTASPTFQYADVGNMMLTVTYTGSGSDAGLIMTGSDSFIAKPDHFDLSILGNPEAANATGGIFVKAGEAFTATVTALNSANNVTPNFGRETAAEGVKLTQNLVLPSGGAIGALSNPTIAGGSFSNGVATVSNLAWDEVGIITLMPNIADADYLGAGDVIGTITGNIGRFYPDHFAITPGTATPYCGTFTYFGQDGFSSTGFVLKAQNLANATTQNYTGSFAKLGLTWNDFVFTTSASLPAGSTLSASATAPTGTWTNGVATITAKHQISRPTALTGETAVTIKAKPVDSDGVTLATATDVAGSTPLRYGRVFLQNAYGSELLDLAMPMTAQYWNGNWVTNTSDSCTSGITLSLTDPNLTDGLATSELCVWDSGSPGNSGLGCSAAGTLAKQYQQPPASGNFNLNFKATGTANTGALDVTAAVPAYLQFNWRGTGNMNPTARATFGVYKGHNKQIYFRELY